MSSRAVRFILVVVLGFVLCALRPPWVFAARRELVDKVIAVVNDEAITQSELEDLLGPVYQQYKTMYKGEELFRKVNEARQALLSQLIEDRLVYQQAQELGVGVTEEEVDAAVNDFKSRFSKQEDLEKVLKEEGMTMTKLRQRYRRQIAIRRLHDYAVKSRIIVSPKEIEDYYKDHMSDFTTDERIRVRTITIRKSPEAIRKGLTDESARAKSEEIRSELVDEKANFAELAQRYSQDSYAIDGGELGYIERGDMIEAIDQTLFSLNVGEISPILESKLGYHIFKIEDKQLGHVQTLDEVKDNIHGILYREKMRERFDEWMEELKKDAYISIR